MRWISLAILLAALVLISGGVDAKSPSLWAQRRIYQVLTDRFARPASDTSSCNFNLYCGGTFAALGDHLDYIAGMGFNAIWISPVVVNYPQGYHGYWATNFFAINPHFGSAEDLQNFVAKAHALDIWIMVDIVVNHAGPVGTDYSQVYPFNQSSHYHQDCQVNNYQCQTEEVYNCRLADLPDLNQSVPFVREQLAKYVVWLLNDFGFDGIRMDTVMYIEKSYWASLQQDAATYIVGEVWNSFYCNLVYTQGGIDATLNYPLYDVIRQGFQSSGSLYNLGERWREQQQYAHPGWEVNFVDNHDNDRFLQYGGTTIPAYQSALAYMFFMEGIPCIYYGTEQLFKGTVSDNSNRQPMWPTGYDTSTDMYAFLKNLSAAHARFQPWAHGFNERWRDQQMYCYYRGDLFVCVSNTVGGSQTRVIPNLPFEGRQVCNWLDQSAPCLQGSSTMTITVPASGYPLVWYAQ